MGTRTTEANALSWVVGELVRQNDEKLIDFDIAVQRGYVWDNKKCSLLIHSILLGIPISEFYFNKVGETYEGLEGKQRNRAICDFVRDGYKLHVNTPPVKLSNGKEVAIARHSFLKLPVELQNRIKGYPLRVYWFDNASLNDKVLIFTRINSGRPVTAADISRIKVLSRKDFISLAQDPAIDTTVRTKGKMRFADEDIVEDIWILANIENPCLLNRFRSPVLESTKMTKEQKNEMLKAFKYMYAFYKDIESDKKLYSKLRAKTHITSIGYMGVLAARHSYGLNDFIARVKAFFNGEGTKVTSNEAYNNASSSGSAKPESVKVRMDEISKALFN